MSNKNIVHEMTDQELLKKLRDEKIGLNKLRLVHQASALDNPIQLRFKRRDIARLSTEINKRNIK
tara:strand:- start:169 stop:363 length:195 start_codon:yes stop_codon:yes gene_type:complete